MMVISIYIFTQYVKITAFQKGTVEKKRNKQLNFIFKASNSKFQAEIIASFRHKLE